MTGFVLALAENTKRTEVSDFVSERARRMAIVISPSSFASRPVEVSDVNPSHSRSRTMAVTY